MMRITADPQTLMEQATGTAAYWFDHVVESIDAKFGEGYAKDNPALVAGMLNACAIDSAAAYIGCISNSLDDVASALRDVSSEIADAGLRN